MAIRKAHAVWEGDLKKGHGKLSTESTAVAANYSFGSRFEDQAGSNPEELIGAAHAGCFSMAFAHELAEAGYKPQRVKTEARVHLQKTEDGFRISKIELHTQASVPDIETVDFTNIAEQAKSGCPVSQALSVPITLNAVLE